jgi:hypothetical protein
MKVDDWCVVNRSGESKDYGQFCAINSEDERMVNVKFMDLEGKTLVKPVPAHRVEKLTSFNLPTTADSQDNSTTVQQLQAKTALQKNPTLIELARQKQEFPGGPPYLMQVKAGDCLEWYQDFNVGFRKAVVRKVNDVKDIQNSAWPSVDLGLIPEPDGLRSK